MAEKNRDFKPDRVGSGGAGRLYLTKKQRLAIVKWLLYSLVCVFLLVVQDVILSQIRVLGATTDLVSAAILLICVLEGAESGGMFALLASMIFLFAGSAPGVYSVALLPLYGVVAAVFRQAYLRKGFLASVICAAVALTAYEMTVFGICLFTQLTLLSRAGIFFMTAVFSMALLPLLYPILVSIGKIGGETWKE